MLDLSLLVHDATLVNKCKDADMRTNTHRKGKKHA
jgi:hypothetical protein